MSIGKEIKVVLTLDDSGFSNKAKESKDVVKTLETGLQNLVQSVDKTEQSLASLGKDVSGASKHFSSLESTLKAMVGQLETSNGFLAGMGKASVKLGTDLGAVSKETKSLSISVAQMKPSLAAAQSGFADLGKSAKDSAKVVKDSVTSIVDAKLKVAQSELENNRKMLAARGEYHAQMRKLESDARAQSTAAMMKAEDAERRLGSHGGKNIINANLDDADRFERTANAMRQQAQLTEQQIMQMREEQAVRVANIASLETERVAVLADAEAKTVAAAQAKQLAKDVSKAEREAVRESVSAARQASLQRITAAREAAAEERRQAEMIGQMWKSMGQLWGAAKIGSGFKASIKDADDYARVLERLDAIGLDGAAGKARTLALSKKVEDANPNMSKTDALKLTMSGVAGTVSTDTKTLGAVLPEIAKVMTVMSRQFPEQAHNLEDFGRNMMGVMEARGITQDPKKMLETLDSLSRALILTQGKMSVQDYETISRRGGVGNAPLKNNESILYDIAAASQMKVMGGGSGGGAGGVSSFATMQKQAEKGAQGGVMEKRSALQNQVEFGIVDKDELLAANGNKPLGRNAKAVPYKNSQQAADNMTLFMMDMVNSVKAKLAALPESDTRFFAKGADRSSDAEQAKAVGRFADQSFSNTSRAEYFKMFATKGSQERIKAEVEAAKAAPSYEESHKKAMESWGMAVEKTNASLEKLGVVIGDVLIPMLQPVLGVVTKIIDAFKRFAQDNAFSAKLLVIGAGFGGIMLGFKGMMGMFGVVGNLSTALATLGTTATTAGASASKSGGMWSALSNSVTGSATGVKAAFKDYSNSISTNMAMGELAMKTGSMGIRTSMSLVGSTVWSTATLVGKAFTRMIPLVGTLLLAWDFAQLLSHVQVGGHEIGEWMGKWLADVVGMWDTAWLKIEEGWLRVKNVFSDQSQEIAANIAKQGALSKSQQDAAAANGFGPEKVAQSKPMDQLDAINDPNYYKNKAAKDSADARASQNASVKAKADADKAKADAVKARASAGALSGGGTGTVDTSGLFKEPGGNKREHVDPLTRALEEARGKVNSNKIALTALKTDVQSMDSLHEEVAAELEGKRLAGDYNKDHDKKHPVSADNSQYKDLVEQTYQSRLLDEQKKALTFSNERIAASTIEADDAMERMADGGVEKQTAALRALDKELVRAQSRLGAGASSFNEWQRAKNTALFEQSRADLVNFSAGYINKNKEDENKLIPDEGSRLVAQLATAAKIEDDKYQMLVDTNEKKRQATIDAIMAEGVITKEGADNIVKINQDANDAKQASDEAYSAHKEIRAKQDERALELPIQTLARQWDDSTKLMEQAQANWASSFVDTLTTAVTKGKYQFGQLVVSILAGIAKIAMQKAVSGLIGQVIGLGIGAATGGATAGESLGSGMSAPGASTSGGSGSGLGGGATFASEKFANGGIMTDIGPASLRKYANGGIANSPQLALYGEGSMNEAYVPLPDGRSIPVTMTGGAGSTEGSGGVTISIVVNQNGGGSGKDSSTSAGDTTGAWSKVADKVKTVVQQEIISQKRPGGLLYK